MPSTEAPHVSVITATWGRGRHIAPTVASVLRQTFRDFELLVVGDCCVDDTGATVAAFGDPRLHWINLPVRHHGQAGPNNAGLAAARGDIVAYLGHDDLWEPHHLADLVSLLDARPDAGFAVAGMILHAPPGAPGTGVAGMFGEGCGATHFHPPSGIAHRREVIDRIGPWPSAESVSAPVDCEFQLRAHAAGIGFVSTGRVSVHKFTASTRYLSYVEPASDEQAAMLAAFGDAGHPARVAALVAGAKAEGRFMTLEHKDYGQYPPGELARRNRERKGVEAARLRPLAGPEVMVQERSLCALDWVDVPRDGIRWARVNPTPAFLLPFTAAGPVRLDLTVFHPRAEGLAGLAFVCNGSRLDLLPEGLERVRPFWRARFRAVIALQPDRPTVLRFHLTPGQVAQPGRRGLGLGDIGLAPA